MLENGILYIFILQFRLRIYFVVDDIILDLNLNLEMKVMIYDLLVVECKFLRVSLSSILFVQELVIVWRIEV